jgi:predicted DNA-binding transcriptional regulator AlpA
MNAETRRIFIAALERYIGLSRSTVSRMCNAGTFPKPAYMGSRRSWLLRDVQAWEAANVTPDATRPMPEQLAQAKAADRRPTAKPSRRSRKSAGGAR